MQQVSVTARRTRSKQRGYTRRQLNHDRVVAEAERRTQERKERQAFRDLRRDTSRVDAALEGCSDV